MNGRILLKADRHKSPEGGELVFEKVSEKDAEMIFGNVINMINRIKDKTLRDETMTQFRNGQPYINGSLVYKLENKK